jgi:Fe-Mn family superoxide dismutase
VDLFLAT